ncbi:MAG: coenzyme F420-0:L-glutamate ligase [bacterium]
MKKFEPIIQVDKKQYERIAIKTHKIQFKENLLEIIEKYTKPAWKEGDWIAISEKVVSVCQNNVRHISTVKAGWLAKLIVKGVKKYPNDIGFSRPEKMQLVVEKTGWWRILIAMILGSLGKIIGIRGIFWRIVGKRLAEIDGFNPAAMYPYNEYAALPPNNPEKVCEDIEKKLGIPNAIIDGNNINVKIIAKSPKLKLKKNLIRKILLDNPMGQNDEMTPIIIVRKR